MVGPVFLARFVTASPRLVLGVALVLLLAGPAYAEGDDDRGAYLAKIMDCSGCHTPGAMSGKPDPARLLAGGALGFEVPELGIFFPPNLTADVDTGLGRWSVDDIVRAVREGVRPDGRQLAPAMPWHAYAALTDADADALAVYIKGLPAVANQVPGPFGPGEAVPAPYFTVAMPAN